VKCLALANVAELDRKIAEMKNYAQHTFAALADRCQGDKRPECPIFDELEATMH
jgi:MerR family transcriptional regulator, copper efflux regulator